MCSLKGRLISEKEEVVCMFEAIPIRKIGNPQYLRVSPDNLEETIDYYDLTDDEKDMPLYRRTIFECLSLLNSLNYNDFES